MRPTLAAAAFVLLATPALADGFAQRDLTRINAPTTGYSAGGEWAARAAPERLTLACLGCDPFAAVDVLVGRSRDGTGDRLRSGATTAADMEAICRQKEPACTVAPIETGAAVGIQSVWPMGDGSVSTVHLYRGTDLLTIRSMAGDAATAKANAAVAVQSLGPQIVGR